MLARLIALGLIVMCPLIYVGVNYGHPYINEAMRAATEESQAVAKLTEENRRAQAAPGVRALRFISCESRVIEVATMPELAQIHQGLGVPTPDAPLVIECRPLAAQLPTCDMVASTYIASVKQAPSPFRVVVTNRSGSAACNSKYGARGESAPDNRLPDGGAPSSS